MLLINSAWGKGFARATTNKKAIADRGWCLHDRTLLDNPEIRATMASDEILKELNASIYCKNNEKYETSALSEDMPLPSTNEAFLHAKKHHFLDQV